MAFLGDAGNWSRDLRAAMDNKTAPRLPLHRVMVMRDLPDPAGDRAHPRTGTGLRRSRTKRIGALIIAANAAIGRVPSTWKRCKQCCVGGR
jgi:hypothetical protein